MNSAQIAFSQQPFQLGSGPNPQPTTCNVAGTQSAVITPYLPGRTYNDLLQFHITAMIPFSYQDQHINSLKLSRMQMIQGMALEEGNQGLTAHP